jgi:hypothetical protein
MGSGWISQCGEKVCLKKTEFGNGVELVLHVSLLHPDCKVLLLSGGAGTEYLLDAARKSAYHFQSRSSPLHPRELIENVMRVFDGSPPPAND